MNAENAEFPRILKLIEGARNRAFSKVNEELVLLYFNIGKIVSEKVSAGAWGDGTVNDLATFIREKQPGLSGFTRRGLYRMRQFYDTYSGSDFLSILPAGFLSGNAKKAGTTKVPPPATQKESKKIAKMPIVSPAATQLDDTENPLSKSLASLLIKITWSNHLEILSGAKTPEEKLFYLLHSAKEKLNKLELRRLIQTATFERMALSDKAILSVKSSLPEGLFKDPYIFEFLELPEPYTESDLEKALVTNLQKFILEIGKGFTYMGRQYPLQVGNKDYRTDLLFYHRELQCLVLFELKIEEFAPEFLGKLNFYLEALDRDVKLPNENPSIGILLCKGKDTEVVEYAMARNTSPAVIADYETRLIDRKLLASKLHQLVEQLSKEDI